jgi:hypothetical protein
MTDDPYYNTLPMCLRVIIDGKIKYYGIVWIRLPVYLN